MRDAKKVWILAGVMVCALLTGAASAAQWHVTPSGTANGAGTEQDPWSIQKAFNLPSQVHAGDTIWMHGGEYAGFAANYYLHAWLRGEPNNPIIVRAVPGERVTIRTDLLIGGADWIDTRYVWFWGLEIASRGYDPNSADAVWISNQTRNNPGIKIINCILHDCGVCGVASWGGAHDNEVNGCLIYNNGYDEGTRGHGHGFYIQSNTGPKLIKDNIVFRNFAKGSQLYGSPRRDYVTHEGNTFFNNSEISRLGGRSHGSASALAFYGSMVAEESHLISNYIYFPSWAQSIGNQLNDSHNAIVRDNYMTAVNSNAYILEVGANNPGLSMIDNTLWGRLDGFTINQYGTGNVHLTSRPTQASIFVRPNDWEPGRANITVFNWPLAASVQVDISSADLEMDQAYVVLDAQNFFGAPVASGVYSGALVTIPMTGLTVGPLQGLDPNLYPTPAHTAPEFGVFVLLPADQVYDNPPVVDAGADQTVTLPANTVSLDGTVMDDGQPNPPGVVTVTWTRQSGPGSVTFANLDAVDTTATFSTSGTHVLRLTASDSANTAYDECNITVQPVASNQAPVVDAGPNRQTVWPTNTASLDGTVTDDGLPLGAPVTQAWSIVSGPGTVSFANAPAVDTAATFSTCGAYVLRLTASDTALSASDDVMVNILPQLALHLPMDETAGTVAADISPFGRHGTLINGPTWIDGRIDGAVHVDELDDHIIVNDFAYGPEFSIAFWFRPDDNEGTTYQYIFCHGAADANSSVNVFLGEKDEGAVGDQLRTLLRDVDDLKTDFSLDTPAPLDGLWHLYTLTVKSGEGSKVYIDAVLRKSDATRGGGSFDPAGSLYLGGRIDLNALRFYGGGLDDVRVYNLALSPEQIAALIPLPNTAPSVSAGTDQAITLPAAAGLDGTVMDDGQPDPPGATTSTWTGQSGPGTVSFANASAVDTTATFSTHGTYVLRLTAQDGELSTYAEVTITVNPAASNPADFNGDGAVSGADFVIWQAHYPMASGATKADGDANGDGAVTGIDFIIWQSNYNP